MPRQAREVIYAESNCFHVLIQGIAKQYVFETGLYKNFYLKLLSDRQKKYSVSILAFCIMDNHAHILVYAENKNSISKCFQEVNVTYAQYYNREQKRVGYVFRNRFKSEPIVGDTYLLNCISYIHFNPVKAKIVDAPVEYLYSSAKNYTTRKGLVDFNALEQLLGCVPSIKDTNTRFLEDEWEGKLDFDDALKEVMHKLHIEDKRQLSSESFLKQFVEEMLQTTKISLRELSMRIGINRERIRQAVSVSRGRIN